MCEECLVIAGDFNIHMDVPSNSDTKKMQTLLHSMNLINHVSVPTHVSGHTLDLIITRSDGELNVSNIKGGDYISDHCFLRLILRKRKFDSARECLKELHWLPVHRRVDFKIALFVYKYKQGILPSYLGDLIKVKTNQRVLRSDGKDLLVMPRTNTESFGKRAFSYAAPKVWNSLPEDIKSAQSIESFKKKLKTHLFKCSFHD